MSPARSKIHDPLSVISMIITESKPYVSKAQRTQLLIYSALFLGYVIFKLEVLITGMPLKAGDTSVYESMAELPIWHPDFLAGIRPFFVPLIYKLMGSSPYLVAMFQWTLSFVAWGVLAVLSARA